MRIFFSGLNGLRAIAALAVVFSHTTQELHRFGLDAYIFGRGIDKNPVTTLLAGFGVSIFFTLSGFLISFILLKEKEVGVINVKYFYIRRTLRIWPLYYLYFIVAIVTGFAFSIPFQNISTVFYILLAANIPSIIGVPYHSWRTIGP